MAAQIDRDDKIAPAEVADLVIPVRAIACPTVHQHHGGCFRTCGRAVSRICDLNAVATTCPLSAQESGRYARASRAGPGSAGLPATPRPEMLGSDLGGLTVRCASVLTPERVRRRCAMLR